MKINPLMLVIVLNCLMFLFSSSSIALSNQARVTLKVIDDDGRPVEGANVGVSFERNTSQGTKVSTESGTSNPDGKFSASGAGNGFISYGAQKKGYYDSYYNFSFRETRFGRWQPWNQELEILLRKIENPVPMYARNTNESQIEIPEFDTEIGFDLIKFDWVIPYGSGTHADFIFHLKREVVDRNDFDSTLTITFSNKMDGIQVHREWLENGSLFKLPRNAPEAGYDNKLLLSVSRKKSESAVHRNFDFNAKDLHYMFRVRSLEEDGAVAKAMYGKILGGLRFDPVFSKTAKIYFRYYLNPDNTRNLEFDPKRNLFGVLRPLEQVGIQ